jgi:ribosomal protein S18 acetylase RimI-like enzyme
MNNTLLNRCTVAYEEAFEAAMTSQAINPQARRHGVAAVLEHLAAELVVMNQREKRLSVHEVAQILSAAATSKPI